MAAPPTLTPVREAQIQILERVRRVTVERIGLDRAHARVVAEPVVARINVPPWDNSAMDGYAVRVADAGAGPLVVAMDIPAGASADQALPEGSAARIMTGAPIPRGADAVVRVEDTEGPSGEGRYASVGQPVRFTGPVRVGDNIRRLGEDVRSGDVVLPAGTVLDAAAVAMMATVGRSRVEVVRRPRVAVITTGDELVDVDEAGAPNRIVNGNAYGLAAMIREAGGSPVTLPIVPDELEPTRAAIQAALNEDAVVTVGGVSVGTRDFVRQALEEAGVELLFWRVAIRPGGPLALGRAVDGRLVFALPGNPVSAHVTFELFARPAIRRMGGHRRLFRRPLEVALGESISTRPEKAYYLRGTLEYGTGGMIATTTGPQGSGILSSLIDADGLIEIPEGVGGVSVGEIVRFHPFDRAHYQAEAP